MKLLPFISIIFFFSCHKIECEDYRQNPDLVFIDSKLNKTKVRPQEYIFFQVNIENETDFAGCRIAYTSEETNLRVLPRFRPDSNTLWRILDNIKPDLIIPKIEPDSVIAIRDSFLFSKEGEYEIRLHIYPYVSDNNRIRLERNANNNLLTLPIITVLE